MMRAWHAGLCGGDRRARRSKHSGRGATRAARRRWRRHMAGAEGATRRAPRDGAAGAESLTEILKGLKEPQKALHGGCLLRLSCFYVFCFVFL